MDIKEKQEKIKQLEVKLTRAEATRDNALATLRTDFGVDSIESARQLLETTTNELTLLTKQIADAEAELTALWTGQQYDGL